MTRKKDEPPDLRPDTEIVPVEATPLSLGADLGLLAHWSALPAAPNHGIMTTLDIGDPEQAARVVNALNDASESTWDVESGQVIRVSDLIAHYNESIDPQTGELRAGPMLTLLGPDGTWHTGSQFAFRALQRIALVKGRPPWDPPVRLIPVRPRSRNARNFQSFVLAPSERS